MAASETTAAPRPGAVVLETIEVERQKIRKWYDDQLRRLDCAAAAFGEAATSPAPSASAPSLQPKPKQRHRSKIANPSPKEVAKRREEVHRWMAKVGRPASVGEVRKALNLTESSAKGAVLALERAGKLVREGTGSTTKYKSSRIAPVPPSRQGGSPSRSQDGQGTQQGRLLARVLANEFTTAAELAQFAGISEEDVRAEMGKLIGEEEVEIARRNGESGYIPGRAV